MPEPALAAEFGVAKSWVTATTGMEPEVTTIELAIDECHDVHVIVS